MPSNTPSWSDPLPPGWLPAALNRGWTYRDRITPREAGIPLVAWYAARYPHSGVEIWHRRLLAGEIERNGIPAPAGAELAAGDRLSWRRPPWEEAAVPATWQVIHDDGDLLVLDKPSGLPVLPGGGFLEHTLLRLLERAAAHDPAGVPRPVHRLGRFTSGLLVCARRPASRAWLSERLREATAAVAAGGAGGSGAPCSKGYRAVVVPGALALAPGEPRPIEVPIGRRPHPLLGQVWCAAGGLGEGPAAAGALPARSTLTLLERHPQGDRVEVAIATGRPHQIRIHCAAIGAPLLGDPLYLSGGATRPEVVPGAGGYRLHAHRLRLLPPGDGVLEFLAPPPW